MTEPNGVHVTQPPTKWGARKWKENQKENQKNKERMTERNKKPPIESKAVETGA